MTSGLLTPTHLLILLAILLLLFGAKRLPETGRALGRGMREFKEAITLHALDPTDTQPAPLERLPPTARTRDIGQTRGAETGVSDRNPTEAGRLEVGAPPR